MPICPDHMYPQPCHPCRAAARRQRDLARLRDAGKLTAMAHDDGVTVRCPCGALETQAVPADAADLLSTVQAFVAQHADCKPVAP